MGTLLHLNEDHFEPGATVSGGSPRPGSARQVDVKAMDRRIVAALTKEFEAYGPPEGESLADVAARIVPVVEEIRRDTRSEVAAELEAMAARQQVDTREAGGVVPIGSIEAFCEDLAPERSTR